MAAGLFAMQSCSSFLEEESQSEVIPETTEDFSEFLIGNGYPDHIGPDYSFISMLDDDCTPDFSIQQIWNQELGQYIDQNVFTNSTETPTWSALYQWQPSMCDRDGNGNEVTNVENAYKGFYSKIMGCNAVLDNIDKAYGTQENRDRVKAEALAVRAFHYFILVNLFGEPYNYNKEALGVPAKLNANLAADGIERATVGYIYENIIVPDLKEAIRLMKPLEVLTKNYRVNQPTLHAILSRVYLFMEKYEDCINEANEALKYGVKLQDMTTINASAMPYGWKPYDYDNPEILWMFGPGTPRTESTPFRCGKGDEVKNLYDKVNDVRYSIFGFPESNWDIFKKTYGSYNIAQNIRVAEVILNRAEAAALANKPNIALDDLNTFCRNRIKNYTDQNLAGDALLKAIRDERRKEFIYEGFRWFDLRRQGMPEIKHRYMFDDAGPVYVFTLKKNDPLYTLPLPNNLLNNNKALQQSPCRNEAERAATPEA